MLIFFNKTGNYLLLLFHKGFIQLLFMATKMTLNGSGLLFDIEKRLHQISIDIVGFSLWNLSAIMISYQFFSPYLLYGQYPVAYMVPSFILTKII